MDKCKELPDKKLAYCKYQNIRKEYVHSENEA